MCGRFTLQTPLQRLADHLGLRVEELVQLFQNRPAERFNVAPSQEVLAVGPNREGKPAPAFFRWGLVPSWAADVKKAPINARAETAAAKATFAEALQKRRCLIPADGFYEWQQVGNRKKQPWHFRLRDGGPFAFAGVWDAWRSHEGAKPLLTCALLTVPANEVVKPVHGRMPAILRPADYAAWTDRGTTDPGKVMPLVSPYPAAEMEAVPVGPYVNKPEHDDPACLAPVPA
jgi:putative SOS response-associated peptidase YedK